MPILRLKGVGPLVELNEIKHEYVSVENPSIVTLTTSSTIIADLRPIVSVGDIVLAFAQCQAEKGLTNGQTTINMFAAPSGGTIQWFNGDDPFFRLIAQPANTFAKIQLVGIGIITSITQDPAFLRFRGNSNGSNAEVAAGKGQFAAFVLKN